MIIVGASEFSGVGNALDNGLRGNDARNTLTGLDGRDVLDGKGGYDFLIGGAGDDYFILGSTAIAPFGSNFSYYYDSVVEMENEGVDTIELTPDIAGINRLTFTESFYTSYTIPDFVENLALTGSVDFTIIGNASGNAILGNLGNNVLVGGAGNDTLDGGRGNDTLDGGADRDTAIFHGAKASYKLIGLSASTGTVTVQDTVAGRGGTDLLKGIERILFDDQVLALDLGGTAGQSYRIYQAAFARTPDVEGLSYWVKQLDSGLSLRDLAYGFIQSDEFAGAYGNAHPPSNI